MNPRRLLLIQDNSLVQNFYREKLERAGFAVHGVASVEEGIRRMEAAPTDFVVIDPLLPDGEAHQSIEAIRAGKDAGASQIFVLPTQQRFIAEAITQNARTHLLPFEANVAASLVQAAAKAADLELEPDALRNCEPDDRWRRTVLNAGPAVIAQIRQGLRELLRTPGNPEPLRTLLQTVHTVAAQMSLLGPSAISQVACAFEQLVYGLYQIPERMNELTLRTVGQAADFLAALLGSSDCLRKADLRSTRVMVVEDEGNARELIIAAMELVGLAADGLDTPGACLAVMSAERASLIFMDINLPEMNGFEVCAKLRAMPLHEHTPIVFLTGMNSFQNRVQSNLSGGNDFVGKPFNVAELGLKALIWVLRGQFGLI